MVDPAGQILSVNTIPLLPSDTTAIISAPFTLVVTDSAKPPATSEMTLTITILKKPPVINTYTASCPKINENCEVTVADATGGASPYYFKLGSFLTGAQPMGMTLKTGSSGAVLSGKPAKEGTYRFDTCVIDSLGAQDCKHATVMVGSTTVMSTGTHEQKTSVVSTTKGTSTTQSIQTEKFPSYTIRVSTDPGYHWILDLDDGMEETVTRHVGSKEIDLPAPDIKPNRINPGCYTGKLSCYEIGISIGMDSEWQENSFKEWLDYHERRNYRETPVRVEILMDGKVMDDSGECKYGSVINELNVYIDGKLESSYPIDWC